MGCSVVRIFLVFIVVFGIVILGIMWVLRVFVMMWMSVKNMVLRFVEFSVVRIFLVFIVVY